MLPDESRKIHYMHLFHGTTPEDANKIAREGFTLGEDNRIWLTDDFYDAMNFARGGMVVIGISGYSLEQFGCTKSGGESRNDPVRVQCLKWDNSLVDTVDIWIQTQYDWKQISKFVKGNSASFNASTNLFEEYSGAISKMQNVNIPSNTAIRTSPELDELVRHYGYEPVDVPAGERPAGVPIDFELVNDAQRRLAQFRVIPDSALLPGQLVNLNLVRAITKKNSPNGDIPDVFAAEVPGASDRVITAGMYSKRDRKIYTCTSQLHRGKNAVETGIHEVTHHTSGGDDGEPEHNAEMSRVVDKVMEQVHSGVYDEYLKNPNFTW